MLKIIGTNIYHIRGGHSGWDFCLSADIRIVTYVGDKHV